MDVQSAWIVARLAAGVQVEGELIERLIPPWLELAQAMQAADGHGRINVLQEMCDTMDDGDTILRAILNQDLRQAPRQIERAFFLVPPIPDLASLPSGQGAGAGVWLDQYTDYAKKVSPLTPDLFHESAGLWLVSLAIARRMVLRLGHKDVFPNLAILWIAPTTLYAKSTGLAIPRHLARSTMRHLLLPGEMTPEAMVAELAGQQPTFLDATDMEDWQSGQAYAGQRGVCLDEASSIFAGMQKDYNIGMAETLLRLYDCEPYFARQTRGTGRVTIRNAYWTFIGATTPWHLKKADMDTLWYTGVWPRFLILTPQELVAWQRPKAEPFDPPRALIEDLIRLEKRLPESTYIETATPVGMALGEEVFEAYSRYLKATMRDMLTPPTPVNQRLWGVYGRLAEQALKVAMLLTALDWQGGTPMIEMRHWARAQEFAEQCRASVHRVPEMFEADEAGELENRILALLKGTAEGEWLSARDLYRPLHLRSSDCKQILDDLIEADLVERDEQSKRPRYRIKNRVVPLSQ